MLGAARPCLGTSALPVAELPRDVVEDGTSCGLPLDATLMGTPLAAAGAAGLPRYRTDSKPGGPDSPEDCSPDADMLSEPPGILRNSVTLSWQSHYG